ncbi:hypothetical protein [Leptospirillum ferriphilum]|uniref:hypothetical protein n=1 Tax=Leptospirillum ferriphilum TaxID=178606 RepID=UPI0005A161D7|nr:hypothetical protein [Leptospirillum ferriphilum]
MKPDKYGTPHEQALHRIGWTAKAQKQCETCKHYELRFDRSSKGSPYCWLIRYRTQMKSGCTSWEEKER